MAVGHLNRIRCKGHCRANPGAGSLLQDWLRHHDAQSRYGPLRPAGGCVNGPTAFDACRLRRPARTVNLSQLQVGEDGGRFAGIESMEEQGVARHAFAIELKSEVGTASRLVGDEAPGFQAAAKDVGLRVKC